MKRRLGMMMVMLSMILGVGIKNILAEEPGNQTELAQALKAAKIPLTKGLSASQKMGQPISGKYELENGKLQLSVYTKKGDKFSEVIVDYINGKILKTETIASGDDLIHAKEQSEAIAKAKVSLVVATQKAIQANKGFKAISVIPSVKNNQPIAEVTLLKGSESKTVSEELN